VTIYNPILKAKPGEFTACRNASAAVLAGTRVVMEVVPDKGEDRDLSIFIRYAQAHWPRAEVLTVDTGFLDQSLAISGTADSAVMWIANRLYDNAVAYRPVMRLDDAPDVLAEVAAAIDLHDNGACLRVGSEEDWPDPDESDALIDEAFSGADLETNSVHLLIDLGAIESQRDIRPALPVATAMLDWADANGPWASVTVASGAFPSSISHLPNGVASPIQRLDADLFDAITATGPRTTPDFGDYAVNHPSMPTPGFNRGPNPSLRYTSGREWQVFRERKALPGNTSFFTVCQQVVTSPYWPAAGAGYSWGDLEVERCAAERGGAGTATQWRAYGTSHHMAHVIDRLASLGEP
jgi:hypothetical protein